MTQSQSITWAKLKDFKPGDVLTIRNTIEKEGKFGRQITIFANMNNYENSLFGINANTQIKKWVDENGHIDENGKYELVIGDIIKGDEPKYDKVGVVIRSVEIPF